MIDQNLFLTLFFSALILVESQLTKWTDDNDACIDKNNDQEIENIYNMANCKALCKKQRGCRSVELYHKINKCMLSRASSRTNDLIEPCPLQSVTYSEIIDNTGDAQANNQGVRNGGYGECSANSNCSNNGICDKGRCVVNPCSTSPCGTNNKCVVVRGEVQCQPLQEDLIFNRDISQGAGVTGNTQSINQAGVTGGANQGSVAQGGNQSESDQDSNQEGGLSVVSKKNGTSVTQKPASVINPPASTSENVTSVTQKPASVINPPASTSENVAGVTQKPASVINPPASTSGTNPDITLPDERNQTQPVQAPGMGTRLQGCETDPDPGECRGAFPRYYFNKAKDQCDCFLFGGCDIEGVRFTWPTFDECLNKCVPLNTTKGSGCKRVSVDEVKEFLEQQRRNRENNGS